MYTILLLSLCFTCAGSEQSSEKKSQEKPKIQRSPSSLGVEEADLKKKHEKLSPNPTHKRRPKLTPVWQMGPEDLFMIGEDPVIHTDDEDDWGISEEPIKPEK